MAFEEFESAVRTDVGHARSHNEDAVLALPEHGVFCVADGIGGAAGGAMASQRVVEDVRSAFAEADAAGKATLGHNIERLRQAVAQADSAIKKWAAERDTVGTGTTLVAFVFDPACPYFGSVLHAGDSRGYRYRQGGLTRLSSDHSIANALGVDEENDVPSVYHGVITHAIGAHESTLEENTFDVEEGDLFLLCSDGLTRMVSDAELEALLFRHREEDVDALAARLVDRANEAGGMDNVSVALIRVGASSRAGIPAGADSPGVDTKRPAPTEPGVRPSVAPAVAMPPPRLAPVAPRKPSSPMSSPDPPPPPSHASPPPTQADTGGAPSADVPTQAEAPQAEEAPPPPPSDPPPRHPPAVGMPVARPRRVYAACLAIFLGVGLCLGAYYLVRHLLHAGRDTPPRGPVVATAAPPATVTAKAPPAERAAIVQARRRVEAALVSGEWGTLKLTHVEDSAETGMIPERATPGEVYAGWLDLSEKVSYDEIYRSWLYLWEKIRYADGPRTYRLEYLAYGQDMDAVWRKLGGDAPLEIRAAWPETQQAQADFVCRESYRLQRILLEQVMARIDRYNQRIEALREERPMILHAVCRLGRGEEDCTERLGAALVAAESRVLALHKWIGMRGVFPLDPDVLAEIADVTLPAIDAAMDKAGVLLHANLRALSEDAFREVCGAGGISDREIANLLLLRDRLLATVEPDATVADWFRQVNPQQLGFFLRRLARKCPEE